MYRIKNIGLTSILFVTSMVAFVLFIVISSLVFRPTFITKLRASVGQVEFITNRSTLSISIEGFVDQSKQCQKGSVSIYTGAVVTYFVSWSREVVVSVSSNHAREQTDNVAGTLSSGDELHFGDVFVSSKECGREPARFPIWGAARFGTLVKSTDGGGRIPSGVLSSGDVSVLAISQLPFESLQPFPQAMYVASSRELLATSEVSGENWSGIADFSNGIFQIDATTRDPVVVKVAVGSGDHKPIIQTITSSAAWINALASDPNFQTYQIVASFSFFAFGLMWRFSPRFIKTKLKNRGENDEN